MLTIDPHEGVDVIKFNMTRKEVARAVGQAPYHARRTEFDAAEYDFFPDLGLFVYYDERDRVHSVEFTRDARVSYNGFELFTHSASDALEWARCQDAALAVKGGFVSIALGLSMHAPLLEEPDLDHAERSEPAESFMIFRRGYHDDERRRLETAGGGITTRIGD